MNLYGRYYKIMHVEPKYERCNIIFPENDFKDTDGCLKRNGHNDHHVCRTPDGKLIAWEDDYECNCGCWDDYELGDSRVCMLYWEVKNIEG